MKTLKTTIIAALAFLPVISMASPKPFEVAIPVDHVFAPSGFDSNDNTEVIVTGFLPNLCYKAPKSSVSITNGKISVAVTATKNIQGMGFCADVIVPFVEYISVGLLDKGKYQININEKSNLPKISNINITEASSNSIDDAIYANVDQITPGEEGSRKVLLKGYNPSDCFELNKIVIVDNGVDTFSVLPKMKQVKTFCPKKMIPFTYEFEVPETLEANKVLLHVRVMDGRSVNAFFNNKPL